MLLLCARRLLFLAKLNPLHSPTTSQHLQVGCRNQKDIPKTHVSPSKISNLEIKTKGEEELEFGLLVCRSRFSEIQGLMQYRAEYDFF
jgi:hypothetical protein